MCGKGGICDDSCLYRKFGPSDGNPPKLPDIKLDERDATHSGSNLLQQKQDEIDLLKADLELAVIERDQLRLKNMVQRSELRVTKERLRQLIDRVNNLLPGIDPFDE